MPVETATTRTYAEEVGIVFSALDCALDGELGVYASSPLTTGKRLYALLEEHDVEDRASLEKLMGPDAMRRMVWDANVEAATVFRQSLRIRLSDHAIVITPAPLSAPGWSQQEYHDFWAELIRTRTAKAYFSHEWQYSNGCVYEFVVAKEAGIPTYDHELEEVDLTSGRELIQEALSELELRGFAAPKLRDGLTAVTRLQEAL